MVEIKKMVNPKDYEIGVVMARFQGKRLHEGHKQMIDLVCNNHNKVIIFLGIPKISNTRRNPLDFATRRVMLQKLYPNAVILPQHDQRYDAVWSKNLDAQISTPFGEGKALLYGSRDSFIPHYKGKHTTTEVTDIPEINGTELRDKVATEILPNSSFRAGVIYANYARRPVTYSTVDVAIYNDKGQILLAKKPHEGSWRFMTRLFLASFGFGKAVPTDDIEQLKWFDISYFTELRRIKNEIMSEHQDMMTKLVERIYKEKLVPNLGEFYEPKVERRDPEAVVEDTTYIPK